MRKLKKGSTDGDGRVALYDTGFERAAPGVRGQRGGRLTAGYKWLKGKLKVADAASRKRTKKASKKANGAHAA